MTDRISTLRPGLLVSLTISISGNVSYKTRDLERVHKEDDGTTRAKWETERVVQNQAELTRAEKVRGQARQLIAGVCARSKFGLLCPTAWEKQLNENIATARKLAADFNAKARNTEVGVYAIVGRVAQDDVEAVRAINSEVRGLMLEMTEGIKGLDVKRVREAAMRARSVGMMLSEEAQGKVKDAIAAARESARKLVKAGEEASQAIDKEAIKKINSARVAFLDLGSDDILPAKPQATGRAVDIVAEEPKKKAAKKKSTTQLDLEDAIKAAPSRRSRKAA